MIVPKCRTVKPAPRNRTICTVASWSIFHSGNVIDQCIPESAPKHRAHVQAIIHLARCARIDWRFPQESAIRDKVFQSCATPIATSQIPLVLGLIAMAWPLLLRSRPDGQQTKHPTTIDRLGSLLLSRETNSRRSSTHALSGDKASSPRIILDIIQTLAVAEKRVRSLTGRRFINRKKTIAVTGDIPVLEPTKYGSFPARAPLWALAR